MGNIENDSLSEMRLDSEIKEANEALRHIEQYFGNDVNEESI